MIPDDLPWRVNDHGERYLPFEEFPTQGMLLALNGALSPHGFMCVFVYEDAEFTRLQGWDLRGVGEGPLPFHGDALKSEAARNLKRNLKALTDELG